MQQKCNKKITIIHEYLMSRYIKEIQTSTLISEAYVMYINQVLEINLRQKYLKIM
jgi:hypothetical protein